MAHRCIPPPCAVYVVHGNDTCTSIAQDHDLSLDQFISYNRGLSSNCSNLADSTNVCVGDWQIFGPVGGTFGESSG